VFEEIAFSAKVAHSQKANFDNLITLFKKRFKDKQHLLDLTISQTHQGRNESVLDYLSRLFQLATNRNISDDILLAVAMNGLTDERGVAPEVVGIGSGAVGTELGGGTNLMMDGLLNDCGVLSGVPGVAEDVDW
jgi:hypothetical protein